MSRIVAQWNDFSKMNAVWDAWVPEGHAPVRVLKQVWLVKHYLLRA